MIGVLIAMQLAGHLTARFGSRTVIRVTAVVVPWFPLVVAAMPGALSAGAGMMAWGLVAGLLDVAMNAQGVAIERAAGRPVLNSLHAMWGIGALAGSLGTVLAVRGRWSLTTHFAVVAVVLTAVALVSGRHLLAERAAVPAAPASGPARKRVGLTAGWTRAVLVLGGLGALVALSEGAVSSWCGVFLQQQRAAPQDIASLGYFAFIVAQTGTRLVGDRLHRRLGAVALVRWSMVVTAGGLVLTVATPAVWIDLAGFALQGCGLAVAIPIIASAVGHNAPSNTGLAIARYSTLHYGGVLAGPAVFGWTAQAFGIGIAFTLLALPIGVVAAFAVAVAPASPAAAAAPGTLVAGTSG